MPRKQKKYHYLYKTTNLITGRYYYGMHSTNDLNDGYLGSGKRLRYSIKKYGRENHAIEILEYCNSRDELSKKEKEVVNLNEIAKKDCMNLKVGGDGGFNDESHKIKFIEASKKTRFTNENNPSPFKDKNMLREHVKRLQAKGKFLGGNGNGFSGKNHSEETKLKMSLNKKGKSVGEKNSQFGTCWITNGISNKKIKNSDIVPNGWYYGRKLK